MDISCCPVTPAGRRAVASPGDEAVRAHQIPQARTSNHAWNRLCIPSCDMRDREPFIRL